MWLSFQDLTDCLIFVLDVLFINMELDCRKNSTLKDQYLTEKNSFVSNGLTRVTGGWSDEWNSFYLS